MPESAASFKRRGAGKQIDQRTPMTLEPTHNPDGSVAPDLRYRDKVAAVEPYGVDAIPDTERHGKPISQFFIWFAAGMNFPVMVLAFFAVSFGLSMWAAITSILAGCFVVSVVMGILSRMGGRLGVAQQIQA